MNTITKLLDKLRLRGDSDTTSNASQPSGTKSSLSKPRFTPYITPLKVDVIDRKNRTRASSERHLASHNGSSISISISASATSTSPAQKPAQRARRGRGAAEAPSAPDNGSTRISQKILGNREANIELAPTSSRHAPPSDARPSTQRTSGDVGSRVCRSRIKGKLDYEYCEYAQVLPAEVRRMLREYRRHIEGLQLAHESSFISQRRSGKASLNRANRKSTKKASADAHPQIASSSIVIGVDRRLQRSRAPSPCPIPQHYTPQKQEDAENVPIIDQKSMKPGDGLHEQADIGPANTKKEPEAGPSQGCTTHSNLNGNAVEQREESTGVSLVPGGHSDGGSTQNGISRQEGEIYEGHRGQCVINSISSKISSDGKSTTTDLSQLPTPDSSRGSTPPAGSSLSPSRPTNTTTSVLEEHSAHSFASDVDYDVVNSQNAEKPALNNKDEEALEDIKLLSATLSYCRKAETDIREQHLPASSQSFGPMPTMPTYNDIPNISLGIKMVDVEANAEYLDDEDAMDTSEDFPFGGSFLYIPASVPYTWVPPSSSTLPSVFDSQDFVEFMDVDFD